MRILVTGGAGFIGSNCIRLLLSEASPLPGAEVVNVDALTYAGNLQSLADVEQAHGGRRYHFHRADIADAAAMAELFAQHRFEAVVHFAAETHVDRSIEQAAPFITTNVLGAQVLLDAARQAGVPRFVHVSTDEVYGTLGPQDPAFTEDTPLRPNSPYAASKAASDLLVRAAHETHGQDVVITRCSNNYGPFQFPEKLIPLMVRKALAEEPLPVYGDGRQVRDWIHVDDHCRGVLLALTRGAAGQAYNFGGAAEMANIDVVRAILDILDKPHTLIRHVADRPGHDRRYAMDFTRARRELGFAPTFDFHHGLEATVRWHLDNSAWVEAVISGEYRRFMESWYKERS